MATQTLAERLGGDDFLEAATDLFNIKASEDEELASIFGGINIRELRTQQVLLLKNAFGTASSEGQSASSNELVQLVKVKGMGPQQYDLMAGHVADTLRDMNITDDLTEEVMAVVASGRSAFCTATATDDVPAVEADKPSLAERLGGEEALTAVVNRFYEKVLEDPELQPFFEGVNMARLRRMQVMFVKYAFGGSQKWTGRSLEAAHARLIKEKGLNQQHFDLVAGHFAATMQEVQVPQDLQAEALAVIGATRPIFDPARYTNDAAEVSDEASTGSTAAAAAAAAASAEELTGGTAAATEEPKVEKSVSEPSLADRLGGEEALSAVVNLMYDKILEDPELQPFFEGVNMARLRRMQVMFVKYAFGGSQKWTGRSLEAAHARLIKEKGLNQQHFDLVAGHFAATMQEVQVPQDLQAEALAVIGATRPIFDPARYRDE